MRSLLAPYYKGIAGNVRLKNPVNEPLNQFSIFLPEEGFIKNEAFSLYTIIFLR